MGKYNRFEIFGRDRLGFTRDILTFFCHRGISIVSLEVQPGRMCIMVDELGKAMKNSILEDVSEVEGIFSVREIELLDYEKNEKRLMAIINAVDEGIVAIDKAYQVTVFNPYCESLFCKQSQEVLGTDIRKLLGDQTPVTHFLNTGEEYDHQEAVLTLTSGSVHYVSSGRMIRDDEGNMVGAVASMKDTNKVRALASIISSDEEAAFKEIIGSSSAICQVKRVIQSVSRSHSTVMLRGESGTGKELFARAIHELSGRKGNYVTINCAALPEALLESELFGYEKGSFTGAVGGKNGLFMEADGGTIFLDEIGEIPIFTQAKLLRVLQEGSIRKVGGLKEEKVDVRVVVATNRNLEEMMVQKQFREDLYYRLNVIPITIPTLEDRKEDIPMLVNYFIHRLNRKLERRINKASKDFVDYLVKSQWPGNVRQLQNTIERAMNLCRGDCLTLEDIYEENRVRCDGYLNESQSTACVMDIPLKEAMRVFEWELIQRVLKDHRSIRAAAKSLGISHTALLNKIKQHEEEMAIK